MSERNSHPSFFRVRNLVFIIGFFILIIIPAFTKLPPPSDFAVQPGKFLASRPLLQGYWSLLRLPGEYQDYFATHFFLRDRGVTWTNEILTRMDNIVFHDVVVGDQGWLFLTDENNLSYYQCNQPFTQEELSILVKRVESMREISLQKGAEFQLLISPNKESIYPEYLPAGIRVSGKACRMDQAIQALRSAGLDVIDLREPLLEAKPASQLFFRTDTHWNDAGAFLVYQVVISELKKYFPSMVIWNESDFNQEVQPITGDLSRLVLLERPFTEESVVFRPIRSREAQIRQGEDPLTIISETGNTDLPNAVVFRDSFFMGLLPFFAENFNRGVYRWSFDFDENLIDTEKPDLVIYELAERYLGILAR
jgi:hypothetical protein